MQWPLYAMLIFRLIFWPRWCPSMLRISALCHLSDIWHASTGGFWSQGIFYWWFMVIPGIFYARKGASIELNFPLITRSWKVCFCCSESSWIYAGIVTPNWLPHVAGKLLRVQALLYVFLRYHPVTGHYFAFGLGLGSGFRSGGTYKTSMVTQWWPPTGRSATHLFNDTRPPYVLVVRTNTFRYFWAYFCYGSRESIAACIVLSTATEGSAHPDLTFTGVFAEDPIMIAFTFEGYADYPQRIGFETACDNPNRKNCAWTWKKKSRKLKIRTYQRLRCEMRVYKATDYVQATSAADAVAADEDLPLLLGCIFYTLRHPCERCQSTPPGRDVQSVRGACCAMCVCCPRTQNTTTTRYLCYKK